MTKSWGRGGGRGAGIEANFFHASATSENVQPEKRVCQWEGH